MVKKIWNIFSTVVVCVVALLALLLLGARILGLQTFVVLSGSMEPHYHVGSVIYVKEVPSESLQVGDDISFLISENTVATHRIVEILPDGRFRTQGTANTTTDEPIPPDRVLGKVVGTIPLLGYLFDFVKHPPGTYITLAAATAIVLAAFVPDIVLGLREQKQPDPTPAPAESAVDTQQLRQELEDLKRQLLQQQNAQAESDDRKEGEDQAN